MKICAFVPAYNEEKRIKYCLQCLKWCDDVFVLDKSSTDRTVEIAKSMGATVKVIPHEYGYDPHELDYMMNLDCEWIVIFTCSDLIDKELALKVKALLSETEADVVYVPFKQYVLGINHKKSPWYGKRRRLAIRKSVLRINDNSVHDAMVVDSSNEIEIEGEGYMYHLTHETVDGMMDRHIRYWRGEASGFTGDSLSWPCRLIYLHFKKNLFKGTFWSGWDLFALGCAHLAYYLMSFVYKWEKRNSHASELYQQMREEKYRQWEL